MQSNTSSKPIAGDLGSYSRRQGILLDDRCRCLQKERSTVETMFVVRHDARGENQRSATLFICSVDCLGLQSVYHRKCSHVIRQFRNGVRACVGLEGGECVGMFGVEQGLRQGRVLASLLFEMFFKVVLRATEKCFTTEAATIDGTV